jgi:flavin reductase (DIM6/NTAB) family NADH-FMN oxidoreductase RutF
MSQSQVAAVLGRIPSGLFVLSIAHDGEETGMLVSWVTQAGFEPPMVSLALRPDRPVAKWIAARAPFVLNVLAEYQKQLVGRFGRGFESGEPAFEGLEIVRTPAGLPALAAAMGYLECRAKSHVDSGDHRIFLAEVSAAHMLADGQPYVHIRKNGLRY